MTAKDRLELEEECLLKYSKANMINKYIDELEENSILTEQWYQSQQKNQELQNINDKLALALESAEQKINKAIEILELLYQCQCFIGGKQYGKSEWTKIYKILKGYSNE